MIGLWISLLFDLPITILGAIAGVALWKGQSNAVRITKYYFTVLALFGFVNPGIILIAFDKAILGDLNGDMMPGFLACSMRGFLLLSWVVIWREKCLNKCRCVRNSPVPTYEPNKKIMKIIKTPRPIRKFLSYARSMLFGLGGIGLVVWYQNYFSGDPSGFELQAKRSSVGFAFLLTFATLLAPLAPLALGAALTYILNFLGSIRIIANGVLYVHAKIENVPNVDICEAFWKFSRVLVADDSAKVLFRQQVSIVEAIMAEMAVRPSFKPFVVNAAAGMRVLQLRPDIGLTIFPADLKTIDAKEKPDLETMFGKKWLANTVASYSEVPDIIWTSLRPLDQEWIVAMGPRPSSIRWLVTSQRVFLFSKTQLVQTLAVDAITELEVSI